MGTSLPSTISRYKILKRLGEGGMGSLYLARDPAIDRLIAIKVLREDVESDELRERFTREAKAVGKLRHQNIVMVFDVGQDAGRPFIAMEYIEGFTLGLVVREKRPITLDEKLKWLQELCDGLAYAHKQGIIHRDIKPANVMVDQDATLKILDFGIARLGTAAASGMTQTGTLMGTLSYMSPEQMTGRPVDHRSDIFAVGAVCYELLAYQRAFPGDIQDGVLHRIIHEAPKALEQFVPGIDPILVGIVNKALEKDRDVRYQDLSEMKNDIARLRFKLQDQTQQAPSRPVSPDAAPLPSKTPLPQTPSHTAHTPVSQVPQQHTSPSFTGQRRGTERAAQLRAQQIEKLMDTAQRAMNGGAIDRAQEACEQVLVLDPNHAEAVALLERAQVALEEQQVHTLLRQARVKLSAGDTDEASRLAGHALELIPSSADAQQVQAQIDEAVERVAAEQARELEIRQALERAELSLSQRAFDTVIRYADQALSLNPQEARAQQIKQKALEGIEAKRRAADEAARRAAAEVAARQAAEEAARQAAAESAARRAAEESARQANAKKAAEDAARRAAAEQAAHEAALAQEAAEALERTMQGPPPDATLERTMPALEAADVDGTIVVPPPSDYVPSVTDPEPEPEPAPEPVVPHTVRIARPPDLDVEPPPPPPPPPPVVEARKARPAPAPERPKPSPPVVAPPPPPPVPLDEPRPRARQAPGEEAPSFFKSKAFMGVAAAAVVLVVALAAFMFKGGKSETGGEGVPPAGDGTLSLNITPYAQIEAIVRKSDNAKMPVECPVTPCLVTLPAGEYNVTARNPDYPPGIYPFEVKITAGQENPVNQVFPGFKANDAANNILR